LKHLEACLVGNFEKNEKFWYVSEILQVLQVTKTHFIAEFFPESFPEFMEPQLHQLFNQLHGRRSREDAAETWPGIMGK